MATPIRLLSPKLLTPKSPVQLGKFLESKPHERLNIQKKLFLPSSPQIRNQNNMRQTNIQIKIKDFSAKEKCLIIKTPEKFEILENGLTETDLNVLGRGAFGTVVTGLYKNQEVAVKVTKLKKNKELNEAKLLNLCHRNIVQTIDVIINSNMNYAIVVMENLGTSKHLQHVLDDEHFQMNEELIVKYATDITKGLLFCHKNDLVHMDLKPGNILVCEDNVCKLCDFGSCYNIKTDLYKDYEHVGTIAYTAPEILLGQKPTVKCDIYSLGITLWQMMFRRIPYEDINYYEIIVYKVVKFGLRPQCDNFQNGGDFLQNLYVSCWSTDPQDRPSCSEVLTFLNCCR